MLQFSIDFNTSKPVLDVLLFKMIHNYKQNAELSWQLFHFLTFLHTEFAPQYIFYSTPVLTDKFFLKHY